MQIYLLLEEVKFFVDIVYERQEKYFSFCDVIFVVAIKLFFVLVFVIDVFVCNRYICVLCTVKICNLSDHKHFLIGCIL